MGDTVFSYSSMPGTWARANDLLHLIMYPDVFRWVWSQCRTYSWSHPGPSTNPSLNIAPPFTILGLVQNGDTQTQPDSWVELIRVHWFSRKPVKDTLPSKQGIVRYATLSGGKRN